MKAHPEVIELKSTLETMVRQPHETTRNVQVKESQQVNKLLQEVYALELDGYLLSIPTHKGGWRNFFRKTSTPIKTVAAGAMLIGVTQGAIATETNNVPPQVAGIHQTVNGVDYVKLKYAPRSLGFHKKDFDWYRSTFDTFLRKTYKGIEKDPIGYPLALDNFAKTCVERKGKLNRFTYNKIVDFYNSYVAIAPHIDSLRIKSEFKDTLKEYYAEILIKEGHSINLDSEKEKISLIPYDSKIITLKEGEKIGDIVSKNYSGYNKLHDEQKRKVLDFIVKINPYVNLSGSFEGHEKPEHIFGDDLSTKTILYVHEEGKTKGIFYYVHEGKVALPNSSQLEKIANK